jgi:hypothetical protein
MKPQIKEYNCETGIETIRDATDAEIADIAARELEEANRKAEAEAKAQAKAELLERLGITADEAKLLLA